jgi:hypothetical protein
LFSEQNIDPCKYCSYRTYQVYLVALPIGYGREILNLSGRCEEQLPEKDKF